MSWQLVEETESKSAEGWYWRGKGEYATRGRATYTTSHSVYKCDSCGTLAVCPRGQTPDKPCVHPKRDRAARPGRRW